MRSGSRAELERAELSKARTAATRTEGERPLVAPLQRLQLSANAHELHALLKCEWRVREAVPSGDSTSNTAVGVKLSWRTSGLVRIEHSAPGARVPVPHAVNSRAVTPGALPLSINATGITLQRFQGDELLDANFAATLQPVWMDRPGGRLMEMFCPPLLAPGLSHKSQPIGKNAGMGSAEVRGCWREAGGLCAARASVDA